LNTLGADHGRKLFPRGPGLGVKTLVLLIVCGSLMAADLDGDDLAGPRSWLSRVLEPVTWVAQIPQRLSGAIEHLESRERLIAENAALRRRQLQLDAQLQRLAALEAETGASANCWIPHGTCRTKC
jgi:rod shape-determining protein MreC